MNYFQNISLQNLYSLSLLLINLEINNYDFLKNKYSETSINFEENLNFLRDINLVELSKNQITKINSLEKIKSTKNFNKPILKDLIITQLRFNKKIFNAHLKPFLMKFQHLNEHITFQLCGKDVIKFSFIRDFLLDLSIIEFDKINKECVIDINFLDLYEMATKKRKLSLRSFKKIKDGQESLSLLAENLIYKIELKKFSKNKKIQRKIEHTSIVNVNAGYDIKSFEMSDGNVRDKFIEVKAVSKSDYKFFFTRNEMSFAKLKKEEYFLHLIPVKSNNNFDIHNSIVISNPMKYLYGDNTDWHQNVELISFFKKIDDKNTKL